MQPKRIVLFFINSVVKTFCIFLIPFIIMVIIKFFEGFITNTFYFPDWFNTKYIFYFNYLVFSIAIIIITIKLKGQRIKTIVLWISVFIWFLDLYIGEQVFKSWKEEERKYISGIEIGITEEKVVEKLGNPFRMYYSSSAPVDYYVKGFSRRKRIIENKVYIFSGAMDKIFYIYFDKNNKVKFISTCGS